ncbi:MAG: ribonuclease III [Acidobacteria bacterium]|nr:MAG: ribonuclease III [Acidobacteriota bacterium]
MAGERGQRGDRASEPRWRARIEEALGYRFRNVANLERALTHRSWAHEHGTAEHNEALEFLGDAVLGFAVAERIVRKRPDLDEGAMTRLRASLVNTRSLAREARALGVGEAMRLGRGEEMSGGREKASLLADTLEALLGAVLLDGGIRPVRAIVARLFGTRIEAAAARRAANADPKTRLQELAQARGWPLPRYRLLHERGPDHAREFVVEVLVNGEVAGRGVGTAKKRAEQRAAEEALARLAPGR